MATKSQAAKGRKANALTIEDLESVGPESPAGRYLRKFWHPVHVAKDLPPGRAKPIEIFAEKFTLYRGESGTSYVTAFRCPHRAAPLSMGWIEGDDLRCRYHGWKFDYSGQCVEQPDEDKPFADKVAMTTYPTREYLGLIFAYLGAGEPPPFPHYPDFDQPGVIVTDPIEVVPCNYWNRLDNDVAHLAWVHRATALRQGREDFLTPRREVVTDSPYGWHSTRETRVVSGVHQDLMSTAHFFMPNVYQFGVRSRAKGFEDRQLWDTKITWTVPVNDACFAAFDVTYTPLEGEEARRYSESRAQVQEEQFDMRWDLAEKIMAGEMTMEEIPEELSAYASFAIEDYAIQVGQGPLAGRGQELFGRNDGKVVLTRRLWLQETQALLEGRALTDWQFPTEPVQV